MILLLQIQRLYFPTSQPQGFEMMELSIVYIKPSHSLEAVLVIRFQYNAKSERNSFSNSLESLAFILRAAFHYLQPNKSLVARLGTGGSWTSIIALSMVLVLQGGDHVPFPSIHQAKYQLLRRSNFNPTFKLHALEPTGIHTTHLGRYKPYLTLRQHQRNQGSNPTTQDSAITYQEPSHLPHKLRTNRHHTAGPGENW